MAEVLQDFPAGPLDLYRQKASFDWKKLKLFISGEDEIRFAHNLYEELRRYQEFHPIKKPLTFDEERYLTFKQTCIIRANEEKLISREYVVFPMVHQSAFVKYGLTVSMFTGIIRNLGCKRHAHFIKEAEQGKITGCFCLTEVGHGSNVKGMKTTATYDKTTKEFIIHTPNFEAAKCWIGGLGNTATHALLYAQLYLGDKNYGLHNFVIPIRDPETLIPYPGITVGDMGEKMGLNGVDNGFIMFKNYRIPRENLLNKNGDVTEDGHYVTDISDDNKRFGASLLTLSATRVGVIIQIELLGADALTIAVRYAAVRRQFGNQNEEMPILEYQTHQYRLLPHLAAVFILRTFSRKLKAVFNNFLLNPESIENLEFLGVELHVLTSGAKCISGWMMRDAVQSCREACGGYGYLKAAGLGDIKNKEDAALTYEGENWVLIQQVSNFLLKLWNNITAGIEVGSPLKSVDFLTNANTLLKTGKFTPQTVEELCQPEYILNIYRWLVSYLLVQTSDRQYALMKSGANTFSARNDTQVFYARKLAIAFIEHYLLQQFLDKVSECSDSSSMQHVLLDLFSLYSLYSLEKFLTILYQGGYVSGEQPAVLIQDAITELCMRLKNEAVALVDVIAVPDFLLNSVLGSSDGQVYRRLEESFLTSPYGLERPSWWKDVVNWKDVIPKPISKL